MNESNLESGFLKVHDGIRDLDADGFYSHLHVEGPGQPLGEAHEGLDVVVPEVCDLVVVGEAALHHVEAEAGAGRDGGQPLARRAGPHPLHRPHARRRHRHLGRGGNITTLAVAFSLKDLSH